MNRMEVIKEINGRIVKMPFSRKGRRWLTSLKGQTTLWELYYVARQMMKNGTYRPMAAGEDMPEVVQMMRIAEQVAIEHHQKDANNEKNA